MALNSAHATPAPLAPVAAKHNKLELIARRFLIPRTFVTVYGIARWGATISTRAEVELSPNLTLGRGTTVSSFTKIKATDGIVSTGVKCGFGTGCFVAAGTGGIHIGDNTIVGPNVSIIAVNYNYARLDVPLEEQGASSQGIRIGRNVWIGAGAVILDGSDIGDNSIVVATSLVNRKFPPNSILQGSPAKVILTRARS